MHFVLVVISGVVVAGVSIFGWEVSKSCMAFANFDSSWLVHLISAIFGPIEFLIHVFDKSHFLNFGGSEYQSCRRETWIALDMRFEWVKWSVIFSIVYDIFVGLIRDIVKDSRN